jgi:hypothetical protein
MVLCDRVAREAVMAPCDTFEEFLLDKPGQKLGVDPQVRDLPGTDQPAGAR